MKNRFITFYGIFAFLVVAFAIVWFIFSVTNDSAKGKLEASQSFDWISRETVATALSDGFMTDTFIQKVGILCGKSRLLSAVVISTPSGSVFTWSQNSGIIQYDISSKARISNTSVFMKDFSKSLDIGDGKSGAVVMSAVMYVLLPDAVYTASKNSFMVILALLLVTLIIIFTLSPLAKKNVKAVPVSVAKQPEKDEEIDVSLSSAPENEFMDDSAVTVIEEERQFDIPAKSLEEPEMPAGEKEVLTVENTQQSPRGTVFTDNRNRMGTISCRQTGRRACQGCIIRTGPFIGNYSHFRNPSYRFDFKKNCSNSPRYDKIQGHGF